MRPHPAGAPHPLSPQLTLVGAVVEDVEGLHGGRASLLVPENEVDPLVEVRRDVLRLLQGHGVSGGAGDARCPPERTFPQWERRWGLHHLTRALRCW